MVLNVLLAASDFEAIRLLARMSTTLNRNIGAGRFERVGFSTRYIKRE